MSKIKKAKFFKCWVLISGKYEPRWSVGKTNCYVPFIDHKKDLNIKKNQIFTSDDIVFDDPNKGDKK